MKKTITIVAALMLTGCNHIKPIGRIGDTEYVSIRTTDVSGPNAVVIMAVGPDGQQTVASFGTSGVLPSAISAGGSVVSASNTDADSTEVNTSINNSKKRKLNPLSPRPPR